MLTGTAAFGPQYQIMYENDTHAPGSVDRKLFERMIKLDEQSLHYLYSEYTDLVVGYISGSRPALEKIVRRRKTPEKILRFVRKKVVEPCNTSAYELIYGGTEEDIIARSTYWCTNVARVACILLQVAGFPARILVTGNTNFPYCGHQVVEVHINGKWHVADANAGVVYPHSAWEIHNDPTLIDCPHGNDIFFSTGEQYQSVGIVNYHVNDAQQYDYTTSGVNDYCRAILEQSKQKWAGGLRWLHGEDNT
ncbi:MAG: transglutaminase domain-containing protein [Oscillospiraceae bacterium]|nr:transglutaminase domain-containing protein [Oscillospiraceae bacterium]